MRQRRYPTKPGTVSKLCPCGTLTTPTQVCCFVCWRDLPPQLQSAYRDARTHGRPLERLTEEIRDHVRQAKAAAR